LEAEAAGRQAGSNTTPPPAEMLWPAGTERQRRAGDLVPAMPAAVEGKGKGKGKVVQGNHGISQQVLEELNRSCLSCSPRWL